MPVGHCKHSVFGPSSGILHPEYCDFQLYRHPEQGDSKDEKIFDCCPEKKQGILRKTPQTCP
ncbi:MAG: hypothetical protein WBV22_06670, partial [Anaerolineaceae bacterium]